MKSEILPVIGPTIADISGNQSKAAATKRTESIQRHFVFHICPAIDRNDMKRLIAEVFRIICGRNFEPESYLTVRCDPIITAEINEPAIGNVDIRRTHNESALNKC